MRVTAVVPWLLTVLAVAIPVEDLMQVAMRQGFHNRLKATVTRAVQSARSDKGRARMVARIGEKLAEFHHRRPEGLFLAVWADPQVCCGQDSAQCWTGRARALQKALPSAEALPPDRHPWTPADLRRLGVKSVQRAFRLEGPQYVAYAKTEWGTDWYALVVTGCE